MFFHQGTAGRRTIRRKQPRAPISIQRVIIIGSVVVSITLYMVASFLIGSVNGDHQTIIPTVADYPSSPVDEKTIGWAVTITGCGSDPITEGAAVLKHAIHLTSIRGNLGGRYDYKMYAFYHPDGEACALTLKDLGYELVRRETPVAVQDIEGKFLRERIVSRWNYQRHNGMDCMIDTHNLKT